jgi:hypothetical protein
VHEPGVIGSAPERLSKSLTGPDVGPGATVLALRQDQCRFEVHQHCRLEML